MSMYTRPPFSGTRRNGGPEKPVKKEPTPAERKARDERAKANIEKIKNTPMKNPATGKQMTAKEKIQRTREIEYNKMNAKGPVTYK